MIPSNRDKDQNLIHSYVRACSTEYDFDCLGYNILGKNIEEFNGLPRPAKWMSKASRIITPIKSASYLFRFFWKYIAFYLFISVQFILFLFHHSAKRHNKLEANKKLAFATCQRAIFSIEQAYREHKEEEILWFLTASKKEIDLLSHMKNHIIDYTACINRKEIIHAFFLSIQAYKEIRLDSNKYLIMQTYTALPWFCARLAINNLNPKAIIIASHHDRWSILADDYASTMEVHNFELVQHGVTYPSDFKIMRQHPTRLSYKLRMLTGIYAYNSDQGNIILENIVDKYNEKKITIKYFSPTIKLTEIDRTTKKKILFIGHPACEELQSIIYLAISNDFDFCAYYKPHPTAKASARIHALGWKVIEDKKIFPLVDFLISYDSTLVEEYRLLGISSSFIHDIRADDKKLRAEINKLIDKLSSI